MPSRPRLIPSECEHVQKMLTGHPSRLILELNMFKTFDANQSTPKQPVHGDPDPQPSSRYRSAGRLAELCSNSMIRPIHRCAFTRSAILLKEVHNDSNYPTSSGL